MTPNTDNREQTLNEQITRLELKVTGLYNECHAWLIDHPTQCRVPDEMALDLQYAEEALAGAKKDLSDLKFEAEELIAEPVRSQIL